MWSLVTDMGQEDVCVAELGPVIISSDHLEPDLWCTLIHDPATFLSARLLRANTYWSFVGEGSMWRDWEGDMDGINVKIWPQKKKKKNTLATTGPCWANLSRQTREAAQQSGKIKTNAPRCSQLTKAITQRNGGNPRILSLSYSLNQTLHCKPSKPKYSNERTDCAPFFPRVRVCKVQARHQMKLWYGRVWSSARATPDTPIPHAAQICPSASCLANLQNCPNQHRSRGLSVTH